jgi:hypothetical protein
MLDRNQELLTHARVAAINILLCITPAILVLRRHFCVIKARKQMSVKSPAGC